MVGAAADTQLRAAFVRRWPHADAADQWWWATHPGTTAPSGAPSREQRLAAARGPLYRPDADPAAAAGYERLAAELADEEAAVRRVLDELRRDVPQAPAPSAASGRRPPSRRTLLVVGGLVVASIAVVEIVALQPRSGGITERLTPQSVLVTEEEWARLDTLLAAGPHPRLLRRMQNDVDEYAGGSAWSARGGRGDDPVSGVVGSGVTTGAVALDLGATRGGRVGIAVLVPEPRDWTADVELLLADGTRPTTRVTGAGRRGRLQFGTVTVAAGAQPLRIALDGPTDVAYAWSVTVRP